VSEPRSGWPPGRAPGDLAQGNAHNRQRVDVPIVAVSGCRIPSAWKTSVNGTAVTPGGVGTEITRDVVDRELERLLGRELTRPLEFAVSMDLTGTTAAG
jgi:hypothetical protein